MNTRDPIAAAVAAPIPDVQSTPDTRQLAIQRVGVKDLRYPLQVRMANGKVQHSVANISLYVHLPATQKGTHMSRFVELLEAHQNEALDPTVLKAMGVEMLERLEANAGRIEIDYPYFIMKAAPVSGVESLLDYQVKWLLDCQPQRSTVTLQLKVPVTSLCPCSKKISEYGAHNQRSVVTLSVELLEVNINVEQLVRLVEDQSSCELYGLLKRPDEKYVTERAYDNPKFVEDLVRDIAGRLNTDPRLGHYVVEAENFESIHNHSAYALIERTA